MKETLTVAKIQEALLKVSAEKKRRRRKEKLGPVESLRTDPIFAVVFGLLRVLVWRSEATPLVYIDKHTFNCQIYFINKKFNFNGITNSYVIMIKVTV